MQRNLFYARYNKVTLRVDLLRTWLVIAPSAPEATRVIEHKYLIPEGELLVRNLGEIGPEIAIGFRCVTAELECRILTESEVYVGFLQDRNGSPMRKSGTTATTGHWFRIPLEKSLGLAGYERARNFFLLFRWPNKSKKTKVKIPTSPKPPIQTSRIDWEEEGKKAQRRNQLKQPKKRVGGKSFKVSDTQRAFSFR